MIFKPQLREVKYDEAMTPKQGFQQWARMFLVDYKGTHPCEQAVPDGLDDQCPHSRATAEDDV